MSCALSLEIDIETIKQGIEGFEAAFGRVEHIEAEGRHILMILAKNPAGFNEVIRTLTRDDGRKNVVLALNDNIADGRDVSWIWDVDFEMLRDRLGKVVCSGIRAADLALRVKYAELGEDSIAVEPDLEAALDRGLQMVEPGETVYLVPTYTAMLELRRSMVKRGLVAPYWEG
jgi:UDP-N-acetylmuramyl tripeptide synthase